MGCGRHGEERQRGGGHEGSGRVVTDEIDSVVQAGVLYVESLVISSKVRVVVAYAAGASTAFAQCLLSLKAHRDLYLRLATSPRLLYRLSW